MRAGERGTAGLMAAERTVRWRRRRQGATTPVGASEKADLEMNDSPGSGWASAAIGVAALALCLPGLLATVITVVPNALVPAAESWAAGSVDAWTVRLATVSPPLTLAGLALGGWAILRARRHTALGRTLAALLLAALLLSLASSVEVLWLTRGVR
jgi:hypothetical protein